MQCKPTDFVDSLGMALEYILSQSPLFERQRHGKKGKEGQRRVIEYLHPLLYFQDGCVLQVWASLKPGAQNSSQDAHTWVTVAALPGALTRTGTFKTVTCTREAYIAGGYLAWCHNTVPVTSLKLVSCFSHGMLHYHLCTF